MPMFMDVHPGLGDATPEDVAAAHARDIALQDEYGVRWLSYWFNDPEGKAFCLVDAPTAEAAKACHKAAHGLMPHDIIAVATPTLSMFLGDYSSDDSHRAMTSADEPDTALRAIMFTDIEGSTALSTSRGDDVAVDLVRSHDGIVRECLSEYAGSEVKHTGDGVLASFASVSKAVQAASEIQRRSQPVDGLQIKIGLSAGEPVDGGSDIYGAAVNLAARICAHATGGQILTASTVRDLSIGKKAEFVDQGSIALKGFPEPVNLFEVAWD